MKTAATITTTHMREALYRLTTLLFLCVLSTRIISQDSLTQIYSKYDFIPGDKVIFYDDFTNDKIGDFPVQWNTNGSGEIVTYPKYSGRWFKITNSRGAVCLNDPIKLPDNYTIEFDVVPQKDQSNPSGSYKFSIISTKKPKDILYGLARPGDAGVWVEFAYTNSIFAYYNRGEPQISGRTPLNRQLMDTKYHISIWVQKERIRIYQDEVKLFDLAKAMLPQYPFNMIRFQGGTPLIGNVRIATGLADMRSKLLTEGKLVSYGIYFDVNSDKLKPQSAGTLKEISTIMTENPAVKIGIIGHTDSDGDDAANLDLSKRRAASVKVALVNSYAIAASRIDTDGKGESEPVAPNDSAVNKALNRRVEFIKR